jgi:hypothetical protein
MSESIKFPDGERLRIRESFACATCGEPSGEQKYCTVCAREIIALELLYAGEERTVSAEPEYVASLSPMLLRRLKISRLLLTLGNVFIAAFLGGVLIWLWWCIIKGLLWVHFERWAR